MIFAIVVFLAVMATFPFSKYMMLSAPINLYLCEIVKYTKITYKIITCENSFTCRSGPDFCGGLFKTRPLYDLQRTQTSLRCLQDVLKSSRRLTTKQDVVTTSGKRRPIYDVLKTSDLRRLEDVQFTTS